MRLSTLCVMAARENFRQSRAVHNNRLDEWASSRYGEMAELAAIGIRDAMDSPHKTIRLLAGAITCRDEVRDLFTKAAIDALQAWDDGRFRLQLREFLGGGYRFLEISATMEYARVFASALNGLGSSTSLYVFADKDGWRIGEYRDAVELDNNTRTWRTDIREVLASDSNQAEVRGLITDLVAYWSDAEIGPTGRWSSAHPQMHNIPRPPEVDEAAYIPSEVYGTSVLSQGPRMYAQNQLQRMSAQSFGALAAAGSYEFEDENGRRFRQTEDGHVVDAVTGSPYPLPEEGETTNRNH